MTCLRWHRLGERCECGHVTVPARFFKDDATQEQAEVRYLAHLEVEKPERYERLTVPSRPITRKHKNLGEVEASLRQRERPHTVNNEPHATNVPKRLRQGGRQ